MANENLLLGLLFQAGILFVYISDYDKKEFIFSRVA